MPRWDYSVNIKQFLGPDEVTEAIGQAVVAELRRAEPFRQPEVEELLDALLDSAKDGATDEFNEYLDDVYTHADIHRVWCGL